MKSLLKSALPICIGGFLLTVSTSSFARLGFTVEDCLYSAGALGGPCQVTGANPDPSNPIEAFELEGPYTEAITLFAPAGPGQPITFETVAIMELTSLLDFAGGVLTSGLNQFDFAGGYDLYAIFFAEGDLTPTGFTGSSGIFELYADPLTDTTTPIMGIDAGENSDTSGLGQFKDMMGDLNLPGSADDLLLATATNNTSGRGLLDGQGGSFRIVWDDFTLTDDGEDFFIDPEPDDFHMLIEVDGDFNYNPFTNGEVDDLLDEIDNIVDAGGAMECFIEEVSGGATDEEAAARCDGQITSEVIGNAGAEFISVPEPATLALLGASLIGFGASRRSKAK